MLVDRTVNDQEISVETKRSHTSKILFKNLYLAIQTASQNWNQYVGIIMKMVKLVSSLVSIHVCIPTGALRE